MAEQLLPNYFADGMRAMALGKQHRDENAFRKLAAEAYGAPADQRNALIGQAVGIDPKAGLELNTTLQQQDDNITSKAAGAARYVLNAVETKNPAAVQGAYQAVRPFLARIGQAQGKVPPEQWSDDMLPMLHQVVAASSGAGAGSVQSTYVDANGQRIAIMRDGRQQVLGGNLNALKPQKVTLPDGREALVSYDEITGAAKITPVSGAGVDAVSAVGPTPAALEADKARAKAEVELATAPQIAAATTGAKTAAELAYAPQTAAAAGQKVAAEEAARTRSDVDAQRGTKIRDAQETLNLLDAAETALGKATGSVVGNIYDKAAAAFGESTEGAQASAQLNLIAGQLVSKVPRFEGPQSNADVKIYQQMAGDLANANLPRETRLAALREMRRLRNKYLTDQGVETPRRRATDRPAGQPRRVNNAADYNALPSGASYIAPDGTVRRKK